MIEFYRVSFLVKKFSSSKKIAITGANGYIGSALCSAFSKLPVDIKPIIRKGSNSSLNFYLGDLCNYSFCIEVVKWADVIIHLAGNTSVYSAEKNPQESLRSTISPIDNIINASINTGIKPRVIFASTATVYGLTNDLPVSEELLPRPCTFYDLHKLFAEQQLAMAMSKGVLESTSLRLSNVYGVSPMMNSSIDRGVLNRAVSQSLAGKDLVLYGDGLFLRDYIYIEDVIKAFVKVSLQNEFHGGAFNIGSGVGVTLHDAFNLVVKKTTNISSRAGKVYSIPSPKELNLIEFRNFQADIRRIYQCYGWEPTISLEEGVNKMLKGKV